MTSPAEGGGGARGGFAYTPVRLRGAYPSAVLPQPTFNLGRLGHLLAVGIQRATRTNRPKRMRLGGLRNGWAHKVMFARSRQVMHRNLYGDISVSEATPKAPTVVLNGLTDIHGVIEVNMKKSFNAPTQVEITINNPKRQTNRIVQS